jgi:hypothetical protein
VGSRIFHCQLQPHYLSLAGYYKLNTHSTNSSSFSSSRIISCLLGLLCLFFSTSPAGGYPSFKGTCSPGISPFLEFELVPSSFFVSAFIAELNPILLTESALSLLSSDIKSLFYGLMVCPSYSSPSSPFTLSEFLSVDSTLAAFKLGSFYACFESIITLFMNKSHFLINSCISSDLIFPNKDMTI